MIVLDTNILIDLEKQNERTIQAINKIRNENPDLPPAITWVTFYEYSMGTQRTNFLNEFEFLSMDLEATCVFLRLKREKTQVSDFDLLIASVVMANYGILVTRDKAFERIKGLNVKILGE